MDLIPSQSVFQLVTMIPIVMAIVHMMKPFLDHPLVSALVNTSLVVLENTKAVWKPILKTVYKMVEPVLPQLKRMAITTLNATVAFVKKAQSMGVSFSTSISVLFQRFEEVGAAVITLAQAASKMAFYSLKSLSLVVNSFESLYSFLQQLVFAPTTLTFADLYNVSIPFLVCFFVIGLVYLRVRSPRVAVCRNVETAPLRRSSRLARKRAFLLCTDMSDTMPASMISSSMKSVASPPNL